MTWVWTPRRPTSLPLAMGMPSPPCQRPALPLPQASATGQPLPRVPPPLWHHRLSAGHHGGTIHLLPCAITAITAGLRPRRTLPGDDGAAKGDGSSGLGRTFRGRSVAAGRLRRTLAHRPPRRDASRAREHVPGAWRGGPGGGRRGRGRGGGGGEVEPGCGRGDRRFPPPSAPHLAGPPLARGPVPRGARASPAGPPHRRSSRRRAARPPPAGSGPSRRRRLPLHGRRSRRLHCGKLTSLAAAAAPPAPALAAMGAVTDGETSLAPSLPPSCLPPCARRPAPRPPPGPLGSPQRQARRAAHPPPRCPPHGPDRRPGNSSPRPRLRPPPAAPQARFPASHPADGPPSRLRPRSPAPRPFMPGHARALGAPRPQASPPGPQGPSAPRSGPRPWGGRCSADPPGLAPALVPWRPGATAALGAGMRLPLNRALPPRWSDPQATSDRRRWCWGRQADQFAGEEFH